MYNKLQAFLRSSAALLKTGKVSSLGFFFNVIVKEPQVHNSDIILIHFVLYLVIYRSVHRMSLDWLPHIVTCLLLCIHVELVEILDLCWIPNTVIIACQFCWFRCRFPLLFPHHCHCALHLSSQKRLWKINKLTFQPGMRCRPFFKYRRRHIVNKTPKKNSRPAQFRHGTGTCSENRK